VVRQASQEIAGEASEELGRLMGTVFGSASIELDTIFGNEVGYFRLKRALRVGDKTRKLLSKYGLKPHEVSHRTAVPLFGPLPSKTMRACRTVGRRS
jgi:hypothetical protein